MSGLLEDRVCCKIEMNSDLIWSAIWSNFYGSLWIKNVVPTYYIHIMYECKVENIEKR